ncbi:centrosome and spindle pole-associated protein 1 isoform X2 [Alosa sapidissima]|uniref:centrosome and spindle pole-associated protein 1 isoform X2 n=1 Tax=Alosa sapidissima TaxID=34773 RepID=UPI001C09350E|nr:centrosome and spindle pole-associated protein 1 isoform X2 [Alosa sapidissima]
MLPEEVRKHPSSDKMTLDDGVAYLEMKSILDDSSKENVPVETPSQSMQRKDDSAGLSLPLGEEYERKKQRLKQELRMDYRRYVSQKNDLTSEEACAQPQELSLPIRERRSAKARLRDERNKEYNAFLKEKGTQAAVTRTLPDSWKVQFQDRLSPPLSKPTRGSPPPDPRGHLAETLSSRRDAATLTDSRVQQAGTPRRRWGGTPVRLERKPRRPQGHYYNSEEDLSYGEEDEEYEEEELDYMSRRRPRPRELIGYLGKRERRVHRHRPDRIVQERREPQAPILQAEEYIEESRRTLSAIHNPNLQAEPAPVKTSERSRSVANKNMADFSTGLIIGTAEGDLAQQRRKERYRQELLEQMAEQQKNKKKEKELELRVAASGAVDPEKQPDRIKQFGAVNREYEGRRRRDVPYRPGPTLDSLGGNSARQPPEERAGGAEERTPPERPHVAFQSPPLVDYSTSLAQLAAASGGGRVEAGGAPINEDFHRNLSGTLGEMIAPRITGAPPPVPPTLPDAYHTPYDDAYYYYAARNPLDPNLAYYGPGAVGVASYPHLPMGVPQPLRPGQSTSLIQVPSQLGMAPSGMGVFAVDRSKQSKENALSYQEALKQQGWMEYISEEEIRAEWSQHFQKIRERQERKMRELEERERCDAKLEAEMKNYKPWGRGGGGAPIKDDHGNLISDLKRMHQCNEEAYLNPESRRGTGNTGRNAPTPREDRPPSVHMMAGYPQGQAGSHARGNVFRDMPTPQQLHEQDRYKEYLKQQIAEKRRKDAEERERQRLEEEREEKKLAEQRARIQQEYEEELDKRRRKEMEQLAKNEELVRQAEERRKEAERRKKEEEERASQALRQQDERERQARLEEVKRAPSPPIPTLQKKLGRQRAPRPPSADSRQSAGASTVRSLSAPHSPPVPARRNQLRAKEEKQSVISELSALSKQLRNEQRRLERQRLQTEREDMDTPLRERRRERPPVDVFDMARLRMQVSTKRPSSRTQGPVNIQNIHDFNQLKYRDSTSREEVRQAYPDPPCDDYSLELQQQALLRHQQRKINNMRKDRTDYFDLSSPSRALHHQTTESTEEGTRPTLLQSESAFIDSVSLEEECEAYPDAPCDDHSVDIQQQALLRCQQRRINNMRKDRTDSHAGAFPEPCEERRERQTSARERRRLQRRIEFDEDLDALSGQREADGPSDAQSLRSLESVRERNHQRMRPLEDMSKQSGRPGELYPDEDDEFWQTTSPPLDRRVSVDTVATEPWLRPGTTETLKNFLAGRRPLSKETVTEDWEGPSTYHG